MRENKRRQFWYWSGVIITNKIFAQLLLHNVWYDHHAWPRNAHVRSVIILANIHCTDMTCRIIRLSRIWQTLELTQPRCQTRWKHPIPKVVCTWPPYMSCRIKNKMDNCCCLCSATTFYQTGRPLEEWIVQKGSDKFVSTNWAWCNFPLILSPHIIANTFLGLGLPIRISAAGTNLSSDQSEALLLGPRKGCHCLSH